MRDNAFGKLVRACRESRGWKQEELARRLGFTREYVSQIECGKRKLNRSDQISRLVAILDISNEQLVSVGKQPVSRQSFVQSLGEDDVLLEAILEPLHRNVKLSGLIYYGYGMMGDLTRHLRDLEQRLYKALGSYQGQFRRSALNMLISVHEMLGRQAIRRVATSEARTSFQAMYDVAEELGDTNSLMLALIHQATMLRHTHHLEASFRRLGAAQRYIDNVPEWLQGYFWRVYARHSNLHGDEQQFLRAIEQAEEISYDIESSLEAMTYGINPVGILEERAHGYTALGQPEKALEIYQKTDKMRPVRPPGDQSAYHIVKAQAYCFNGNLETGIRHANAGLRIAKQLGYRQYILRLQQMCDRLDGKEPILRDFRSRLGDVPQW